jgi:predicted ATPase
MYQYKIDNIIFNDGSSICPGALTIIVGPNNCGKSRILKDIKSITSDQIKHSVVVTDVKYSIPDTVEALKEAYNITTFSDKKNNLYLRTLSSSLVTQHNIGVGVDWEQNCQNWLNQKNDNTKNQFRHWFGSFFVSLFETEDRLKLIKESESSEKGITNNLLQAFYYEGSEVENKLRVIVKEAFGKDIRLDFSTLRKILFRIGKDLEDVPTDLRDAISYYEQFEKLDEQGDGLRSFVATLLVLLVGKRSVLLFDEPESFLHPPQAFRLGEVIAEHAVDNRQLVVATHSSDFLKGVLSKRQDITILRVDRHDKVNKINMLKSNDVAVISKDPLLSSTRIMDGLFYKGAIIVEADSDAVFYQRISRQLDDADNYHIAHAHNKQTAAKVLSPYKLLGIPFSTIVDFDVIRVRDEFRSLITQIGMPKEKIDQALDLQAALVKHIENVDPKEMLSNLLSKLKNEITRITANENGLDEQTLIKEIAGNLKRIRESGNPWKTYKKEGIVALDEDSQIDFYKLDLICSEYGLFIVPVGELESLLVDFGLPSTSKKSKWIVKALEKIPELHPDVEVLPWCFVQRVFQFLNTN